MAARTMSVGRLMVRDVRRRVGRAWRRVLGRTMIASGPGFNDPGFERRQADYAVEMRRLVGAAPWCVDSVTVVGNRLEISGWAIPIDGDPDRISIRVDGVAVDQLEYGLHRPDVAAHYGFLPGADRCGFRCMHRPRAAPTAHWTLEYADRQTGKGVERWHNFYVNREELLDSRPLPSLRQIHRVHGGNSQNQHLIEGYSTYVKFAQALQMVTGRSFDDFRTILDFGCGCGRLARYFPAGSDCRLVGTDIDRENVEWCRTNLSGEFLVNSRNPPLPLDPASVDCVVANDVFTHLSEADGRAWLQDIARVCRDQAMVLVSIASEPALARARLSAEHYAQIRALDFIDLSRNTDLDDVLDDPAYYRNVFHSHSYLRTEWSRPAFAILEILAGLSGNQHDLVIMQRVCRRPAGLEVSGEA